MILNMPVANGALTPAASSSQSQSEFCDFLKRKYPDDNGISPVHHSTASPTTNSPSYPENHSTNDSNAWKKPRHIDEDSSYEIPPVIVTSTDSYSNQQISPLAEEYPPISDSSQTAIATSTTEVTTATSTGTFNIIANSSAFINDLFAYDANLMVPVSSSETELCHGEPSFSTPSNVCVNTTHQYEEDNADNWQATDLLELDHRYNSSLQTEITHLNPTVSLKPHEETLVSLAEHHHNSHTSPPQPPTRQPQTDQHHTSFLQSPKSAKHLPVVLSQTANMDSETDFEDKNLSWLLNFKFDEFPHLNPDVTGGQSKSGKVQQSNGSSSTTTSYKSVTGSPQNASQSNASSAGRERSKSPKHSNKTGKKFEELVMEVTSEVDGSDMVVAENVVIEDTSSTLRLKKPPFTYTELIEYALEDKGELTVSGIYTWISDRFPYYKSNDDRWKNSVRHNLSINPHFRKGHKAPQGAGHLWTISSGDSAENVLAWEHKKQRLDLFFKMESMNRERLAQHQQQLQQQSTANARQQQHQQLNRHSGCQQDQQCLYDEAAVAAAAIQQEMLQQQQQQQGHTNAKEVNLQHRSHDAVHHTQTLHDLPYNELLTEEELRKTAGQILNGIHREVEVQSVNHQTIIGTYQDVLMDNEDYLNPIHKDIAVNESGLRHITTSTISPSNQSQCHSTTAPYYVTEIDPMELGIQMSSHPNPLVHSHAQGNHHHHHHHHHHHGGHDHNSSVNGEETDVVLFNDEFNLNYFTYNPATDMTVA